MLELNRMTIIEAKLDVLMRKMNTQERISHSANIVGIEEEGEHKCMTDEGLAHEGPYQVEEAQFVSGNRSYNFKPNNNLPTHYTPALRNHEIFFLWKWSAAWSNTSAELSSTICSTTFLRAVAPAARQPKS